jgi:AraC-like DNA-binding protein
MVSEPGRSEVPPPGTVAWLAITEDSPEAIGRVRRGPLALQILPMTTRTMPFSFHGGRLRGTRCFWSASTVSGVRLVRTGRTGRTGAALPPEPTLHLLARVESPGSVFDVSAGPITGCLRVLDSSCDVDEQFPINTHLYTLNVPIAGLGIDPDLVTEMIGHSYQLSPLQFQLLRSAVGLLRVADEELTTMARLVGMDRYLGGVAGLLLRTAELAPEPVAGHIDSVRSRVDAIIREQAADPVLSPVVIAAQLAISLRQLYRAFDGTESPAARIRRRRLELAAELLASRPVRPQVESVAQQCGFVSAEYFSRAFRREFGLSPRAYRTAHREVPAAD